MLAAITLFFFLALAALGATLLRGTANLTQREWQPAIQRLVGVALALPVCMMGMVFAAKLYARWLLGKALVLPQTQANLVGQILTVEMRAASVGVLAGLVTGAVLEWRFRKSQRPR
jgi:hypothetical protein